jgi:hypothetical protein
VFWLRLRGGATVLVRGGTWAAPGQHTLPEPPPKNRMAAALLYVDGAKIGRHSLVGHDP